MEDYWKQIRDLVGSRPLILAGANVILIDENNKILLHLRSQMNMWGLPGGFCEIGESTEDTARREVLEEIGLHCDNLKLFNVYSGEKQHIIFPNGDEVYNVTATYICREFTGIIEVNPDEGMEARFFAINELPENIVAPIKIILNDFISYTS